LLPERLRAVQVERDQELFSQITVVAWATIRLRLRPDRVGEDLAERAAASEQLSGELVENGRRLLMRVLIGHTLESRWRPMFHPPRRRRQGVSAR
jgi:hypothetical protein